MDIHLQLSNSLYKKLTPKILEMFGFCNLLPHLSYAERGHRSNEVRNYCKMKTVIRLIANI
jgi:hypothetical protein